MRILVAAAALIAPLAAQTFVVDAGNGPGTSFTDIAAAVAAVPSGSTLVVRPATYPSFAIAQKSLTILAEPGVAIGSATGSDITITSLLADQRVVLRGLDPLLFGPYTQPSIVCSGCQGAILLDHIGLGFARGTLRISQCSQVLVGNCGFLGTNQRAAVESTASDVTIADSTLLGALGHPGLAQTGGRVHLVATTVSGPGNVGFIPAAPAIAIQGGQLRCDGASAVHGGGGFAPAIVGAATARIGPATTITGAQPLIAATVTTTFATLPSLQATGGQLGGVVSATMSGAAGQLGVMSIGLPSPRLVLPGFVDPVSLAEPVALALGVFGAPLTASAAIPNTQALLGKAFGWQGLTFDTNGVLLLSNAAWFVVH